MSYLNDATGRTPAHLIYLIDASGSMEMEMPGTKQRKIDFVSELLENLAYQIYVRAKRGNIVSERYRLAIYVYNDGVIEVTNGEFISVEEFMNGIPEFGDLGRAETNTFLGFRKVQELLGRTIPKLGPGSPAPIVCHLTDGEYTERFGNPSAIMKGIMNLVTPDGKVLLENIFLGDKLLVKSIANSNKWEGVASEQEISNSYAKFLYEHSSAWPDRYVQYFNDNYKTQLKVGTRMFFPAEDVNIVKMAFTASAATPMGKANGNGASSTAPTTPKRKSAGMEG